MTEQSVGGRRSSRVFPAVAALLIFLAAAAALLHSALWGGQVLSAGHDIVRNGPFPEAMRERAVGGVNCLIDNVRAFVPWLRFAADGLSIDGHIPLWKDTAGAGAPFLGNGQSAVLYPTNLLAILLGAPAGIVAVQALLKLAAGAFCAWLLARHLGLSFLASLLCGFVFGFGGYQMVWYLQTQSSVSLLLPLLVLAADRLALRPSPARAGVVALVAGLQHLGGHPETAFHCQVAVFALACARLLALRAAIGGREALRRLGWIVAGLGAGFAIGAVQVMPMLEYISQSMALARRKDAAVEIRPSHALAAAGFGLALLVALLALRRVARAERPGTAAVVLFVATVAGLLAGLAAGLRSTFIMPLSSDWFGTTRSFFGTFDYHEQNGAFAGAALPLAALGLLAGRPRGTARVAGIALGFGLLAGYHAPIISDVLEALPIFRVAMNGRLQLLSLLATAVLAGFGLDALGRAGRSARERWRPALVMLVPSLAAIVALAIAVRLDIVSAGDAPPRQEGALLVEAKPLTAALADPVLGEPAPADPAEPCRLFRGYIMLPEPPDDIRLFHGSIGLSVGTDWRAAPVAARDAPDALASSQAASAHIYVFRGAVPERKLLPGPFLIRVRATLPGHRFALSGIMAEPEAPGTWLPFPAQPAPGGATPRVILIGLLVLGLAMFAPDRGHRLVLARLVLPVLVAASLLPFAASLVPLLPPDLHFPPSPAIDVLRDARPEGRFMSMTVHNVLPEAATYYGVADLRSYDGIEPERVLRMFNVGVGGSWRTVPGQRPEVSEGPRFRLLGLMSVRYISNLDPAPPDFPRVVWADADGPHGVSSRRDHFPIVENPYFLPRARLVGGAVVEPDDERGVSLLCDPGFRRASTLVLPAGEPREPPVPDAGSAHIVASRPDRVRVEIDPAAPGWLVLSDTFFPGWKAWVDGQPREIVRANVAFRAVAVAPGERVVEFRYEPLSVRVGAAVSVLGLLLVVGSLFLRSRGGRAGERSALPGTGEQRPDR